MMNYIKSEFYRVFHSAGIYGISAGLAGLALLFNAVVALFGKMEGESFRYNTTSYSYSNLVACPMLFCVMGAVIALFLYEGNRKNGNLKNTIAFGIPRIRIFAGECIVATVSAVFCMVIVLSVYIASAMMLLRHTGPVELADLLTEIPAVFLLAVAALISALAFIEAFGKEVTGIVLWFVIWYIIPRVLFYLGLRFDVIYDIAMWMPGNFFSANAMIVNTSECMTIWQTAAGMARCVISGMIGIAVFYLSGAALLRKREI